MAISEKAISIDDSKYYCTLDMNLIAKLYNP